MLVRRLFLGGSLGGERGDWISISSPPYLLAQVISLPKAPLSTYYLTPLKFKGMSPVTDHGVWDTWHPITYVGQVPLVPILAQLTEAKCQLFWHWPPELSLD